eukprot:TRINITY_DN6934_c0_g1_i4.p1 TRINITY_DN6934_c0_g1~~TRINITY_DN6934_c0_g1_i4.p1  ORF type:complete len:373 (+),score=34.70 TRINITY_DN6934_c0_g1_i4:113-1231(+)
MQLSSGKGLTPITDETDPVTIFDGAIAGYKNEDDEVIELLTCDDIQMLIDCYDEEAVIDVVLDSHLDGGGCRQTSDPFKNFTVTKHPPLHNGRCVNSLSYNRDFTQLVSIGDDRRSVLYDVVKKKILWSDTARTVINSLSYSPVRDHFLVGDSREIRLFDATDVTNIKKRSTFKIQGWREILNLVHFSCGELFVASGYEKGTNVFDIVTRKIVANFGGTCDVTSSTTVNRTVVAHAARNGIELFDIRRGGSTYPAFHGHRSVITSLQTSFSGNEILSGSCDGTVMIHDLRTGGPILTIAASTKQARAMFAGDQQQYVVTGCFDSTVRIWDTFSGSLHLEYPIDRGDNPWRMCCSRNQFYCGTWNGELYDFSW